MRAALFVAGILLALWSASNPALACACCSNEGQRLVETQAIDDFTASVLADVRFADDAHLYTGEADIESVQGLTTEAREFRLSLAKGDKTWSFEFAQAQGGGTLSVDLPRSVTRFEIDPRNVSADTTGLGPILYKEWRFTGRAKGTGMFRAATGGGQKATLILHGRGNSCTDAQHFNAWTLVLHSAKINATFYGALRVD